MIHIDHPLLPRNIARATVLGGFLVVDQELAVLAVAVGLVPGDTDHREDRVRLGEDGVHFLEGAVGCFGVEEVDDGEDDRVTVLLVGVFLERGMLTSRRK